MVSSVMYSKPCMALNPSNDEDLKISWIFLQFVCALAVNVRDYIYTLLVPLFLLTAKYCYRTLKNVYKLPMYRPL